MAFLPWATLCFGIFIGCMIGWILIWRIELELYGDSANVPVFNNSTIIIGTFVGVSAVASIVLFFLLAVFDNRKPAEQPANATSQQI